jgi:hypothetical protein
MFRHVVLVTWAQGATEQAKRALHEALPAMPAAIDTIREYRFGPDAGLNPANCDYAIVADFDDVAGYLRYRDHPAHRDLVERYVNPVVARRSAVQFEW